MLDQKDIAVIGACGLNCSKCSIYQAYTKKDKEAQKRIVKQIFGEKRDIKPEQITCEGCRGSFALHWSPDCKILRCSTQKHVRTCSECSQLICPELNGFYAEGHEKAKTNALRQKEVGLEEWWKEQKNPE
jgi:hypothetical protein